MARRGKHDYIVWHHVAKQRTLIETIRKNVKWSQAGRAVRLVFIVVVTAYALWYRAMCVDVSDAAAAAEAASGGLIDRLEAAAVAAEAAAAAAAADGSVDGATGVGAGFDDRADATEAAKKAEAARLSTLAKAARARAAAAAAAAAKPSPLTMLEPGLVKFGCEAGTKLAPIAVALLAAMFVSGSGVFTRVGQRMANKAKKKQL